MQKKLIGFFCLTFAAALLTGCGKQGSSAASASSSAPEQSNESSESSVPAESAVEAPSYNGTFNETVFEQVCKDIHVADSVITVPGTLKDCGPHFSAEYVLQDKENELLTYSLMYDGKKIGYVTYDGNAELDEKELETATFYNVFIYNERDGIRDITVGGISISDPPDKVPEVFGKPTDYMLDDEGFGYWLYELREGYYLKYTQADGEIYKIGVSAHPVKSNLNSDHEESES